MTLYSFVADALSEETLSDDSREDQLCELYQFELILALFLGLVLLFDEVHGLFADLFDLGSLAFDEIMVENFCQNLFLSFPIFPFIKDYSFPKISNCLNQEFLSFNKINFIVWIKKLLYEVWIENLNIDF